MLNVEISDYFISRVSHISASTDGTIAVLVHDSGAIVYAKRAELAPVLFPVEYLRQCDHDFPTVMEVQTPRGWTVVCVTCGENMGRPLSPCDHNYPTGESYNATSDKWEVYCFACSVTIAEFERKADYR